MVKLRKRVAIQQQEMSGVRINQGHAKRLFLKRPVWQSLLIVAFPSIMTAFVSGLFIFISQVLLIDLIPLIHTSQTLNPNNWFWGHNQWGWSYQQFVQAIHAWNHDHPSQYLPVYRLRDVIKSANSFATPMMMIVTATVLLASQGAAVIYSKTLGIKQYRHATDVYYEAIIVSFVFCGLMLIILYGVARTWIDGEAQLPSAYSNVGGANGAQIAWFYQHFADVTVNWSVHFIDVYMISTFLQSYTLICTYFLNSEGRNNITMLIVTFSNFLGIFITFALIWWAKLPELYGASIAFSVAYGVNVLLFLIYMDWLGRRNLTCLCIRPRPISDWNWREVWMIIYIGLGNFFKNMSIAFTASFSLQILNGVNEAINGPSQALFYSSVNGIVLPLYNLMYLAMIGVVRGARSVTSYLYGAHDFKRVRETYWYTVLYTTVWSTFLFFLVAFLLAGYKMPGAWGTHGPLILIFNLHYAQAPAQYLQSQYLLMIYMLQLAFFGFANAGELLFQACEKPFWGIIVSLTLGVFVLFPVLFIMRAISLHVHSVVPTLWVPMVDGVVSSTVIGIISVTYMYTAFKREEQKTIAQDHQKLFKKASIALVELEHSIATFTAMVKSDQEIDVDHYKIFSDQNPSHGRRIWLGVKDEKKPVTFPKSGV